MNWVTSLPLNQPQVSWEKSSTTTRTHCQPVWSAVAGILIRATKFIKLTPQVTLSREIGLSVVQEEPSSGVISMPTTETIWPSTKLENSCLAASPSLAIETHHLEVASDYSTSLRMVLRESISPTLNSKLSEIINLLRV
jgi:hypothetical protein